MGQTSNILLKTLILCQQNYLLPVCLYLRLDLQKDNERAGDLKMFSLHLFCLFSLEAATELSLSFCRSSLKYKHTGRR
jgi:hypothetical protein